MSISSKQHRIWATSHTATAEIDITEEENDSGVVIPCVYATCNDSGDSIGPIWGDGEASVKRALATLTEECSCGATFHTND